MAITFVQKSSTVPLFGSLVTPALSGVGVGNFLCICIQYYCNAPGGASVTPSGWSAAIAPAPIGSAFTAGDDIGLAIYYLENTAGGSYAPAVTITNGAAAFGVMAEFSGVALSGSIDKVANGQSISTTQSRASGTTAALSAANDLAIACMFLGSSPGIANAAILDPPSGFSSINVDNNTAADIGLEACYQLLSSASAIGTSWTWTDSGTVVSGGV